MYQNILRNLFLVGVSWGLLSCGSGRPSDMSKTNAIIGIDQRQEENDSEIISKVGSLNYQGIPICTVFASSRNEVTTAAHCFSDLPNSHHYSVSINKRNYLVRSVSRNVKTDLAVLSVPGVERYFESAQLVQNEATVLSAFAIEKGAVFSSRNGNTQSEKNAAAVYHSHDTVKGSSGAPILQNKKVVAVHLGTATGMSQEANFAVLYQPDSNAEISRTPFSPECHSLNPFCGGGALDFGQSTISVCGVNMSVPTVAYAICAANVYLLPAGCTVGTAVSAGGICAVNISLVAAACSVSIAKISEIAINCTK